MLSSPLDGYSLTDVLTFLQHVYKDLPLTSEQEAWDLLPIADQFDSPTLTDKAISAIESAQGSTFLERSTRNRDVFDWWHLADRFNLVSFRQRCIRAVAKRFEVLQQDHRLLSLQPSAAVELMQALQHVIADRTRLYTVSQKDDWVHQSTEWQFYFCTANSCPGHQMKSEVAVNTQVAMEAGYSRKKQGLGAVPALKHQPRVSTWVNLKGKDETFTWATQQLTGCCNSSCHFKRHAVWQVCSTRPICGRLHLSCAVSHDVSMLVSKFLLMIGLELRACFFG